MVDVIFDNGISTPACRSVWGPYRVVEVFGEMLMVSEGKESLLLARQQDGLWHVQDGMGEATPPYESVRVLSRGSWEKLQRIEAQRPRKPPGEGE